MIRWLVVVFLLLLGILIGASVGVNLIGALAVFDQVGDAVATTADAGTIAGAMFDRLHVLSLVLLVVLTALGLVLGKKTGEHAWIYAAVLLIMALALLCIELVYITPEIENLRETLRGEFGSVGDTPDGDPRRGRFGMLHGVSMLRALAELLLEITTFVITGVGIRHK